MLGCVTRGSRNIAFAMNTDDVVIWFTEVWFTEVKTLGSHNLSLEIQRAVNGIDDVVIKVVTAGGDVVTHYVIKATPGRILFIVIILPRFGSPKVLGRVTQPMPSPSGSAARRGIGCDSSPITAGESPAWGLGDWR
jgi:hypothetical protein